MSLPERPGLLHAVPVCDLFVILWLMFLLGSSMVRHFGVAVELPPSQFQLERYQDSHVITLGPGDGQSSIHLGRDAVGMPELRERFAALAATGAQASSVVLMQADAGTPVGLQRQVSEMVLGMGFRLALVGSGEPRQPDAPQSPTEDP